MTNHRRFAQMTATVWVVIVIAIVSAALTGSLFPTAARGESVVVENHGEERGTVHATVNGNVAYCATVGRLGNKTVGEVVASPFTDEQVNRIVCAWKYCCDTYGGGTDAGFNNAYFYFQHWIWCYRGDYNHLPDSMLDGFGEGAGDFSYDDDLTQGDRPISREEWESFIASERAWYAAHHSEWNCSLVYVNTHDTDPNARDYLGQSRIISMSATPALGGVKIFKSSSNPSLTASNASYSLSAARYELMAADGTVVATFSTDGTGESDSWGIKPGSYTLRESKASQGYLVNGETSQVTVAAGEWTSVSVDNAACMDETPDCDPADIIVQKLDMETGKPSAQGAGTLAGAEFLVTYYDNEGLSRNSTTRSWTIKTDADGRTGIARAYVDPSTYFVGGDEFYVAKGEDGSDAAILPVGWMTIQETKAPAGYQLSDSTVYAERIEGRTISTFNPKNVSDQVVRGDFEFTKALGSGGRRLACCAFLVSSETTGESHVVVTDENGFFSSAASQASHADKTNANDQLLSEDGKSITDSSRLDGSAGVWFGANAKDGIASVPDDSLGALPYDTYDVQELNCSANAGTDLCSFKVTIHRAKTYPLGTVDNNEIHIGTTARDGRTGTHHGASSTSSEVIDTVSYDGLTVGTTYSLDCALMDTSTGRAVVDADGNEVKTTKEFTPSTSVGTIDVSIRFDASRLSGTAVTCFERLSLDGIVKASHEDISDEAQTVSYPRIKTVLSDGDGLHDALDSSELTLLDTVSYEGLEAGREYVMSGTLVDRETGNPVEDEGKSVASSTTFTPESSSGTTAVSFTFDASDLEGKSVVAFEACFDGETQVCDHADRDDANQTVAFPRVRTQARSVDGTGVVNANGSAAIVDHVYYENLTPTIAYDVTGTLMDRATGEAMADADGKPITATVSFTPDEPSGMVDVSLSYDASGLTSSDVSVVFETISRDIVDAQGKSVAKVIGEHRDLGDEAQSVTYPAIRTEATDGVTGAHEGQVGGDIVINDVVTYENLAPGERYELTGTLMTKDAMGEAVELLGTDGNPITASTTFIPESPQGQETVTFRFSGVDTTGLSIVAFEKVMRGEETVCTHADINDESQTVEYPGITTRAKDQASDGNEASAAQEVTIVDSVSYVGLTPGKEYVASGMLMDKSTGEPYRANGEDVASSTTFVPDQSSGSVDVTFAFDGSDLDGSSLVAFETVSREGKTVAEHRDLGSESQTVSYTKPAAPSVIGMPQTGGGLIELIALFGGIVATTLGIRRLRA